MDIEYLRAVKKTKKMTLQEIALKSNIPKRTVDDIFSGHTKNPRSDTIKAIEKALGIETIQTAPEYVELNDTYPIPLLGSVVAGVPLEAQQDLEGYIYVSYRPAKEYFALRIHGDSMKNVGITDKCIVICHKQQTAENGEIVIAMLNGEQTIKRFKVHNGNIYLMPENPDYMPIPVTPADDFMILGKVVEYRVAL